MSIRTRIFSALFLAVATAVPAVSLGQATTPPVAPYEKNGLTTEQYDVLDERVREFCEYLFALKRDGKPAPTGDVRLPGAGDGYVFRVGEITALIPACDNLMPLMLQLMKPVN